MYVSIGQASQVLGVSISTLRRWEKEAYYLADYKTKGGHRRYCLSRIKKEFLNIDPSSNINKRKNYLYARVSSAAQRLDLERQKKRLISYCKENSLEYELISDLDSGMNFKKKGLNNLIDAIVNRKVSRLILTHRDRLLRFGSPLLFKLCKTFNTQVLILDDNNEKVSFEQELAGDVIEIITVFTSKLYGQRSHKNRKKCLAA